MKFRNISVAILALSMAQVDAFAPATGGRRVAFAIGGSNSGLVLATRSTSSSVVSFARTDRQSTTRRQLAENDDDEDEDDDEDDYEGPLAKGIDSVSWLPSVVDSKPVDLTSPRKGAEILPLFPLGGIVYTPNSEHVLNIFEPRYRQMYTDILMNGTKRFVVSMSHPTESGRFATTGVLFELEELKEVSEQTADQIKYICNHKVTGRVHIHQVLNPSAWSNRDTYLKVEGTIEDDSGREKNISSSDEPKDEPMSNDVYGAVAAAMGSADTKDEKLLKESFSSLVDIQHDLEEDVRFTKASAAGLAIKPGPGKDGLWQTIRLWQSFADQRLMARQNDLQKDFQEKLQDFLKKEKGLSDSELPSAIGFQDLSPALQQEVQDLQKRMAVELQPLVLESTLTMQKLLEAKDHDARCKLLKYFVDAERKRLSTKKTLTGMFSGKKSEQMDMSGVPAEEQLDPAAKKKDTKDIKDDNDDTGSSGSASIFLDEPDAWG